MFLGQIAPPDEVRQSTSIQAFECRRESAYLSKTGPSDLLQIAGAHNSTAKQYLPLRDGRVEGAADGSGFAQPAKCVGGRLPADSALSTVVTA